MDGTFLKTEDRPRFYKLFQQLGVNFFVVLVKCDEETVRRRCAPEPQKPPAVDYSEADYEVYLMKKPQLETDPGYSYPFHDDVKLVVVDTTPDAALRRSPHEK